MTQVANATTTKRTFSRETSISVDIQASPKIIWQLLTTASDMPRWNSTIVSLDGIIQQGDTIQLKSTLDEKRTFKLKVKEFMPEQRLVWGDSQGKRVYTLTPKGNSVTTVTMTETIGGPIFPLFARFIPDFDESFEQFAADLKHEAEAQQGDAV
ncbi:MAG: SRPBCC domain-containing protein [Deinococcota bacterium]